MEVTDMFLTDRADGVEGHFCITRKIGSSIFVEYWDGRRWSGFGRLYSKSDALDEMRRLGQGDVRTEEKTPKVEPRRFGQYDIRILDL